MSRLELRFDNYDAHDYLVADAIEKANPNAEYKYAGITHFQGSKVFLILDDFLQPDTEMSLDFAVTSILRLLPNVSDEIWTVSEVVVEIAQQIPYHHPSHIKLARVTKRLLSASPFRSPCGRCNGQRFNETMTEAYSCCPDSDFPERWPNLMAFSAHLSAMHTTPHDPVDASRIMRNAFEERHLPSERLSRGEREQLVIGAPQWILWDGIELYKNVLAPESAEDIERYRNGRLTYFSEHTIIRKHWHLWKTGFEKATDESRGLSEECRKVAKKAATLMSAIEESLTF